VTYNLEQISAVAFFANRGMRIAVGNEVPNEWTETSDLTRASYRSGVLFALTFRPTEELQHEEWRRWLHEHGQTHENDVPWWQLRPQERDKDGLFLAVVNYLASQP
jgi:hypothetical protein